ncbi:MAG: ABC transporter permease [Bacteroidales bacterium]|nr:ABC transporter permease [Bacteroidales bacterium]
MNWKLHIAHRLYSSSDSNRRVSRPAIRIAQAGIAMGLAVMMLSVAVAMGFQHQVRDKMIGVTAELTVRNLHQQNPIDATPIHVSDSVIRLVRQVKGVAHTQCYATKPGMIKTDNDFLGMVLKGIGSDYDTRFLQRHLVDGCIPQFSDSVASNKVVVSNTFARKLHLAVGDKIRTYYVDESDMRARQFTIVGIYETHLTMYDELFLLTDLYTVRRLNHWDGQQVSGMEIAAEHFEESDRMRNELSLAFGLDSDYYVCTIEEAVPEVFAWLRLLDMNVWIILVLMMGVAGFTVIAGLLILILERIAMIATLKALGANNVAIRSIFLHFATLIVCKGMLWGNVCGLVVCFVQQCWQPFTLDPATYYVNAVPIELGFIPWLSLNIGTLVVSILMLVVPSGLIAHIHPAKVLQFE